MMIEEETHILNEKVKRGILIVDYDRNFDSNLIDLLKIRGHRLALAYNRKDALKSIMYFDIQVALVNINANRDNIINLITKMKWKRPGLLCVMIASSETRETAIMAIQHGAYDYVLKPVNGDELIIVLDRCFEKLSLESKKEQAEQMLVMKKKELDNINARLSRIVKTTKGLTSCSSIDQIGPMLLEEFAHNMAAEGGSLFLRESDGLVLLHSLDPGHAPDKISFPLNTGSIFEHVMAEGIPVMIQDIEQEYDLISSGWKGYRHGSLIIFPILDEAGETKGIISLHNKNSPPFTSQDIEIGTILASYTFQILRALNAFDALIESEDRFRMLAEQNIMAIEIFQDGKVMYVNQAAIALSEYSIEELMRWEQNDFIKLIHSDDLPYVIEQTQKNQLEDQMNSVNHCSFRIITKNHRVKIVDQYSKTIFYNGKLAVLVALIDITDRKNLEEQLLQLQKMEAIGLLAGGVAHDFNNILTSIMGYSNLLLMSLDKHDSMRSDVEEIIKLGEQAASLTHQLLAFSRKQALKPEILNLNILINNLYNMLRRIIGEDIDLVTVLNPDLWTIKADPDQIEQVVINLAVNARDAMPGGGKLLIETNNVIIDESYNRSHQLDLHPGLYLILSMIDTGIGMDHETRAKIFEPFFTTREAGKGTGLGLATVYGIVVQQSNGYIYVSSEPGKGTTFRIYLPAIKQETGLDKSTTASKGLLYGSETILIVEDEDALRALISKVTRRYGYNILKARNGTDAINIFRQHEGHIHLMITDIVMPDMNGYELAEQLLSIQPEMKALYMSGYPIDHIVDHTLLNPEMPFIQKPFSPEDLMRKVREALDVFGPIKQ